MQKQTMYKRFKEHNLCVYAVGVHEKFKKTVDIWGQSGISLEHQGKKKMDKVNYS
jgi:hypothetical protein